MHAQDIYHSTPLFAAVRNGHEMVVELLVAFTKAPIDFKDGLGRDLSWWAARSGCTKSIELVRQLAQNNGVAILQSDLDMKCSPVKFDESTRRCDVCTRNILCASSYSTCRVCHDFDICLECFDIRVRCQSISHEWFLHQPDGTQNR